MSTLSSVKSEDELLIVLDASLTHENTKYNPYPMNGGISVASYEFNGFKGLHNNLHGFVLTLHEAYSRHLTLKIIPDDFWTIILQGIAQHVACAPEDVRAKLVKHTQGRVLISVRRDNFVRGKTTQSEWEDVMEELTVKVLEHTTEDSIAHTMQTRFGTTTPLHRTLYASAILSTLQHYASYRTDTLCGIPSIIMCGTVDDWRNLLVRFEALKLAEFSCGLALWSRVVTVILERIVKIREISNPTTQDDIEFLKSIYKYENTSGGAEVTGWIVGLFPYIKNKHQGRHLASILKKLTTPCPPEPEQLPSVPNSYLFYSFPNMPGAEAYKSAQKTYDEARLAHLEWKYAGSVASDSFPTGLTDVPFVWNYLDEQLPMTMYVGFDVPLIDWNNGVISTRLGFSVSHSPSISKSEECISTESYKTTSQPDAVDNTTMD